MCIPIWGIVLIAVLVIIFVLIFIAFSKINKNNELIKELKDRLEEWLPGFKSCAEKASLEPKSASNEHLFTTVLFTWFRDTITCIGIFTLMVPTAYFILYKVCGLETREHNTLIIITSVLCVIGIPLVILLIRKMMVDSKKILKNKYVKCIAIVFLFAFVFLIIISLGNLASKLILDLNIIGS